MSVQSPRLWCRPQQHARRRLCCRHRMGKTPDLPCDGTLSPRPLHLGHFHPRVVDRPLSRCSRSRRRRRRRRPHCRKEVLLQGGQRSSETSRPNHGGFCVLQHWPNLRFRCLPENLADFCRSLSLQGFCLIARDRAAHLRPRLIFDRQGIWPAKQRRRRRRKTSSRRKSAEFKRRRGRLKMRIGGFDCTWRGGSVLRRCTISWQDRICGSGTPAQRHSRHPHPPPQQ